MSGISLLTGFGLSPDHDHFAHFRVLIQGGVPVYPDWDAPELVRSRQFAGSSSFLTQVSGFGPSTLALRLQFDDNHQFDLFTTKRLTEATLVLLAGFTSHEGVKLTALGQDYEQFPNTMLLSVSNVVREIGGGGECTAVFQRAWDPRLQEVPS